MKKARKLAWVLPLALLLGTLPAAPAMADDNDGPPVPNNGRPAISTEDFDVEDLQMVDDDALPQTQSLFAYLKNVGKAGYTLFGHQNDATDRIINNTGVISDTYNSVGAFPGVHGYSPNQIAQVKDAYRKGGIIAIEHHIGFNVNSGVGGGSYGNTRNPINPVERVLPGGPNHQSLINYLDNIANWASQYLDDDGNLIPVIYRPWHEHNGDWFWWNTSNATEGEFRELFRFTVEYLRDVKGVTNFIYAFSPNGHFENEEEYLYAYPGDEYVDLLGVDVYWDVPQANPQGLDLMINSLRIAQTYANKTGKIAALTETGIRWNASDGLKLADAEYELNWYTEMQTRIKADPIASQIAYMLVWRNGGTNHFWVPFKGHPTLGDHEMLPDFINYYNRDDVVFADRVGDYTGLVAEGESVAVKNAPFVKIHSPVFKKRTSGTETVRVYAASGWVTSTDGTSTSKVSVSSVTVRLGENTYAASKDPDSMFWVAEVDTTLVPDGRPELSTQAVYSAVSDGKVYEFLAEDSHDIFVGNLPTPTVVDPYLIDDFESYDSTDDNRTDLERIWWRDGQTMNGLRLRNSDDTSGHWLAKAWNDGMDTGAVLRVKYDAVRDSFSQVTRPLPNVDWSNARSLSLRVQPDGKGYDLRFRFVVAGTGNANSRTFEVSLNNDVASYGYNPMLNEPQNVMFDLGEFKNINTGVPATSSQLASVTNFSIRFVQQTGAPQMAGLNALEYYLFDDLRVTEAPSKAVENIVAPAVTGTAGVGRVLTATAGTWDIEPVTTGYQWFRGDTAIEGATAAEYTVTGTDIGADLWVRVTTSAEGRLDGTADSDPVRAAVLTTVTVTPRTVGPNVQLSVSVKNDDSVPVTVTVDTLYGSKTFTAVQPGKSAAATFNARASSVPAGDVAVAQTAVFGGQEVSDAKSASYAGFPVSP